MDYIQEMKARANLEITHESPQYKEFMVREMECIKTLHNTNGGGLEIASYRSALIDEIIILAFSHCLNQSTLSIDKLPIGILAVGGYGRGYLNPGSDIDILFLLPKNSHALSEPEKEFTQSLLYILWDLGLKLGHSTRSVSECIKESQSDQQTKTALMDARFITGSDVNFISFQERFQKESLEKNTIDFFEIRREDIRSRHKKYSYTVFLQEPHVKESCGGLRDFQNVMWLARVKKGFTSLDSFVEKRSLTRKACNAMREAYDFLHRVRNELHFHTGSSTDILTLQLQGVVATNFNYAEKSILRRCESFMRDYYRHTRALHQHANSLLEIFEIEIEDQAETGWRSWLSKRRKGRETFDTFSSRNGRIYPAHSDIFTDHPHQLMALFLHCQQRELELSPQIRKLIKRDLYLIDDKFRSAKNTRETFRAILESKGQVARILRLMHRVGFLGAHLPEFGKMDCLVQHEFFHRYTADEHTLRCIDQLDALVASDDPKHERYKRLLQNIEDPYALYIALILHDSGRAENVREHIDGSAMLASQVCNRLQIRGGRRKRIMFLVDHHLTFWRFATTRNLEDSEVIEEFAGQMKLPSLLSDLFLFTYADSNGTNEEAWSPWKETLMIQLYQNTLTFMKEGKETYTSHFIQEKEEVKARVLKILKDKYHEQLDQHFDRMADNYFQFRDAENIALHVRAARRFLKSDASSQEDYMADMRWIDHESRGYTELIVTCKNKPLLLEKICCSLAAEEITIMSADVFTRTDGLVCDIFRVSTLDWEAITNQTKKDRVLETFTKLASQDDYDPTKYLKRKKNLLRKHKDEGGIPFPLRAYLTNELSDDYSAIQVQALDRIGLLHDLFLEINKLGLATVSARICTEKGAALNTIYVAYPEGDQVTDQEQIAHIEAQISIHL